MVLNCMKRRKEKKKTTTDAVNAGAQRLMAGPSLGFHMNCNATINKNKMISFLNKKSLRIARKRSHLSAKHTYEVETRVWLGQPKASTTLQATISLLNGRYLSSASGASIERFPQWGYTNPSELSTRVSETRRHSADRRKMPSDGRRRSLK